MELTHNPAAHVALLPTLPNVSPSDTQTQRRAAQQRVCVRLGDRLSNEVFGNIKFLRLKFRLRKWLVFHVLPHYFKHMPKFIALIK